jgi:nitrite reductase (cytochrome c-552)
VAIPDLSTKPEAQAAVGVDVDAERKTKKTFPDNVIPKWDAEAAAREKRWDEESGKH